MRFLNAVRPSAPLKYCRAVFARRARGFVGNLRKSPPNGEKSLAGDEVSPTGRTGVSGRASHGMPFGTLLFLARRQFMKARHRMLRSWKIGRAFGIPLYVHSTFLLLPAWGLYESIGSGWATKVFVVTLLLVMFGCVVLHELGHALMARYFGIRTRDITLYPIGGVARLERMSEEPAQEVAIALAGPAVNLIIVA